jgi:galactose mutarotase-like enzyme
MMQTLQHGDHTFHEFQVGPSRFLVCMTQGARLMRWSIDMAQGPSREVLYWPENPNYDNFRSIRGGNPILFPFCARTYCKGLENAWHIYYRNRTENMRMPRHGFAIDHPFDVLDLHENGFLAALTLKPELLQMYPFNFGFMVRYTFQELGFEVELILNNRDIEPIPWAPGHHFYFNVPWHPNLQHKHYRLHIPTKKAFLRNPDGSLRRSEPFTMPTTLDDPSLLDRMHYDLKTPTVRLEPLGGQESIQIDVSGTPPLTPFTTITTWTESPESPFYCIEPWMAPANAPEHEKGLSWVASGQTHRFHVRVSAQ